jgi:hypothetical protein
MTSLPKTIVYSSKRIRALRNKILPQAPPHHCSPLWKAWCPRIISKSQIWTHFPHWFFALFGSPVFEMDLNWTSCCVNREVFLCGWGKLHSLVPRSMQSLSMFFLSYDACLDRKHSFLCHCLLSLQWPMVAHSMVCGCGAQPGRETCQMDIHGTCLGSGHSSLKNRKKTPKNILGIE